MVHRCCVVSAYCYSLRKKQPHFHVHLQKCSSFQHKPAKLSVGVIFNDVFFKKKNDDGSGFIKEPFSRHE